MTSGKHFTFSSKFTTYFSCAQVRQYTNKSFVFMVPISNHGHLHNSRPLHHVAFNLVI